MGTSREKTLRPSQSVFDKQFLTAIMPNASRAALRERIASNFITSSSDPKVEDISKTTSSPSVSAVTDYCMKASLMSSAMPETSSSEYSAGSMGVTLVTRDAYKYCSFHEGTDLALECYVTDALNGLAHMMNEVGHAMVTSPPYFRLRSYLPKNHPLKAREVGQEQQVEEYIANLVTIFREARRVLRDDGTLWVVIGDSYSRDGGRRKANQRAASSDGAVGRGEQLEDRQQSQRLGQKQRLMIPWRLALAMQADGWYFRQDIVWQKPNPTPESVKDRCSQAHEYVLMFSKRERYYFDHHAIKEPCVSGKSDLKKMAEQKERISAKHLEGGADALNAANDKTNIGRKRAVGGAGGMRNARSVWTIATVPFKGKHFATFPPKLVERILQAATSPHVCTACGTPYRRVLGSKVAAEGRGSGQVERKFRADNGGDPNDKGFGHLGTGVPWNPTTQETLYWERMCNCTAGTVGNAHVIDPFAGAMTTAIACERLGRDFTGVELYEEYARMGAERVVKERLKAHGKTTKGKKREAT